MWPEGRDEGRGLVRDDEEGQGGNLSDTSSPEIRSTIHTPTCTILMQELNKS